jgi:TatD DNase family protein
MPKYFDIHAHLHFSAYKDDRDALMARTLPDTWVINIGSSKTTSEEAVALAHKYPEGVYAAVGLHPIHTDESFVDENESESDLLETEFDYEFYKKLALDPKVVAIGECGLDFFHLTENTKAKQIEIFKKHIDLSLDVNKPLMLHVRDAYEPVLEILKEYKKEFGDRLRGNVHFFAGSSDIAREFLKLGFTLSFTGVITYPKSNKPNMPDYETLIRETPIESIMAETDAPYVAPVPYRGKRNESLYVAEVVKKIAEIKGIDIDKISEMLVNNARRSFGV